MAGRISTANTIPPTISNGDISSDMDFTSITKCSTSCTQEKAKLYRKLYTFKNPYLLMRIVEADTLRVLASQFLRNHSFLQERLNYKVLFSEG